MNINNTIYESSSSRTFASNNVFSQNISENGEIMSPGSQKRNSILKDSE
jgi:hypothetical protein